MKRLQIVAVADEQLEDCIIVLAEKEQISSLKQLLTTDEMSFVERMAAEEVGQFFFPRAQGAVLVRMIKPEQDEYVAIEATRLAGNSTLAELRQYKIDRVTVRNLCTRNLALAFVEGMALGSYQFQKHLSKVSPKDKNLREIRVEPSTATAADVEELNHIVELVFETRDLVNEPFSHQSSVQFAQSIAALGEKYGFETDILGREKIESLKMGGLISVNKGSQEPPRFAVLEWKPANARNEEPLVFVGKGVVYDTGGLSLKPTDGMDYMKCDMAGGAAVACTLALAAATRQPVYLVGLVPITDNVVGNQSFAPGDVITMYSGKTVEVMNTDAEGRLILADALHYARKYNPALVIDVATLTGGAVRTFGSQASCYMGTANERIKKALEHSGMVTYERLWELPLFKEYAEDLKSCVADIKNLGSASAGTIVAGKFLENFVDYPWLHIDIAGPAYLRSGNGYRTKEGSGVGVRLLYHFLKTFSIHHNE